MSCDVAFLGVQPDLALIKNQAETSGIQSLSLDLAFHLSVRLTDPTVSGALVSSMAHLQDAFHVRRRLGQPLTLICSTLLANS